MPKSKSVPSYTLHKPTGQARVIIDGRHVYLGKHGTDASKEKYARLLAEQAASPTALPPTTTAPESAFTVRELLSAYWLHCECYYRKPDGTASSELANIRQALRFARKLYDTLPASQFGPLALKVVRQAMIDKGLSRSNINRNVDRVRRAFRWAVENELLPPGAYQALKAVAGLRAGRSKAKESEPVKPVPLAYVDAALPYLSPTLAAAVRVQLLAGCRPGEVLAMRACDLDMTGNVWIYKPASHKTAWRGHDRQIYLGPKAQEIIKPFLTLETTACIFSPRASRQAYFADRRASRKSKVQPSQKARGRNPAPKRAPGDRYSVHTYGSQIRRACVKADTKAHKDHPEVSADERIIPHWHPHQLRHNRATELKRAYGVEVARVILGHRSPQITEVYAEADIDVEEGVYDGHTARQWDVQVIKAEEARQDVKARQADAKQAKRDEQLQDDMRAIVKVIAKLKGKPETQTAIKERSAIRNPRFSDAWASLIDDGTVEPAGEIVKGNNRSYESYKLRSEDESV